MESLVPGRISDSLTKAGDCYLKGMYDKCIQTLQLLCEEAKTTHSLLEVCNVDKCVFCCLIENNILVSKGLALKWTLHDAYSAWNDLLQSFSDLHQQVKSLQMVYRVPVKCYLNIVYNTLYWGWCHPNGLQCDESHIEMCMQIAVSCFKRAYACYHSNDAEACLLSLLKLESLPLSTQMKVRGHLLHGSLLAKQGRHFEALQEFFKSLSVGLQNTQEKKDFYPVTLYHIAEEYGALHCMCKAHSPADAETVQNHGKSSSRQTELLQALLLSDHLDTLQHLVQVLKDDDDDDDEEFAVNTNFTFSIQLKILKNLHPQPEINLPGALFKLATTLAANGNYSSAGKMLMELLTQPNLQPLPSLVAQLPHVSVIYHSAAVLLLRSNELDQAQHLCRQAISYHSSKSYSSTDMENCLLCLEDDLIALMLLAQVHKHKGDEIEESEILDRCLRLVNNYIRNEGSVKYTAVQEEAEGVICETNIIHLLSSLAAKLHLQKAQNYLRRGCAFQDDSFFELKQALLCNSGDQDVASSYKRFLQENHQYYGHDKSMPQNKSFELHIENCSSLALKHLLQSQVSEESDVDFFLES